MIPIPNPHFPINDKHMIQHRSFCLASTSARRHDLLKRYDLNFSCFAPEVDETTFNDEDPQAYTLRIAEAKAQVAKDKYFDSIILAGDTIVVDGQKILGKPRDEEDAIKILHQLSGKSHKVFSAYTILDATSGKIINESICTDVFFKKLIPEWIKWYVQTGEPMDKAGAYSIQGIGTIMVEKIQGSYNNVVGFPVEDIFWKLVSNGWIEISSE